MRFTKRRQQYQRPPEWRDGHQNKEEEDLKFNVDLLSGWMTCEESKTVATDDRRRSGRSKKYR